MLLGFSAQKVAKTSKSVSYCWVGGRAGDVGELPRLRLLSSQPRRRNGKRMAVPLLVLPQRWR